jgi:GNAT superfamily N-acetyltransferase
MKMASERPQTGTPTNRTVAARAGADAVKVRVATLEDAAPLAELARALLEHERSLVEAAGELNPWAASREELRKQLQLPNTRFFVAERVAGRRAGGEERRVVGYVKAAVIGKQLTRHELGWARWLRRLIEQAGRWAFVTLLSRPRPPVQIEKGYIAGAFVHPDARRSRVGRVLVAAAEDWFREQGIETCELHVLEANGGGRGFWEEVGYAPVSVGMRKKL